jgi:hypothetical protein
MMTKVYTIRRQHDGSQLHQRAPPDFEELSSYRRRHVDVSLPAVEANSCSFVESHRRQRKMTWNRTSLLFCRLVAALSMIAVATGHSSERTILNLDLEAEFFYAVEASHQTFGYNHHSEVSRSLQIPTSFIPPSFPPFSLAPFTLLFSKSSRARRFDI